MTISWSTPKDRPTWGQGVNAGLAVIDDGYSPDYIHLTADDLEAHEGWFESAIDALNKNMFPAPRILNPDGSLFSFGHGEASMFDESTDYKPTNTSVVPTLTFDLYQKIGKMAPWHFYTDNYYSHRAREFGFVPTAIKQYCFTHHASEVHAGAGVGRHRRMIIDGQMWNTFLTTGEVLDV
jgi:hypothetical protein